jgi:hypothetical protein
MVYNTGLKLNKEETLKSGNISCEENGEYCVYEIPDDVNWEIEEFDGQEKIREVGRIWE